MTCRCRSGECDPECDGPMLRAEIERLKDGNRHARENEEMRHEIERLRGHVAHRDQEIARLDTIVVAQRAEIERLTKDNANQVAACKASRAKVERLKATIHDAAEAFERGSTSAPVLESLKAALKRPSGMRK